MKEPIAQFRIDGQPIFCTPYGNGHINRTYLVLDDTARLYILQRINRHVFKDPVSLMRNIEAVTNHLRQTGRSTRQVLTLIPARDGNSHILDDEGEYWRTYAFVSDSVCFEKTDSADIFRESAVAFGQFACLLADFPAHTLTETIPNFHNTPVRYDTFRKALAEDPLGRVKQAQAEIDFALARASYAAILTDLQKKGDMPLRVTHNDTKLNNVLFDRETRKGLCVIDLDTVMPGLAVNDFGDSIRFGASTAAEDEQDLSKVRFSLPLFAAYTQGYLSVTGDSLTPCETDHLADGAKMMTLECGVRFLTDYILGDTYFKIHRPGHNLDRCRTQFKLVTDMERQWDDMRRVYTPRKHF